MEHVLQIDVTVLAFISGTLIPLAVGLLTKLRASSQVKASLNLVLTVVAGLAAAFTQAHGSLSAGQVVTAVVTTYLASGVTYDHLWEPLGVAQAVQKVAPSLGIGAEVQPITPEPPAPVPGISADVFPSAPTVATPLEDIMKPAEPETIWISEANRVSTLKGHPVYHDPDGYLLIPLDKD